ncbi:nucleotidyltransferase domain-containing protein [Acidaminobacter sp. JC074]|uniref:nucleotidyltransferase domain-containing protein n=1 Tax=Acidaminobacter sp. JC074 TaxID=2530199 RepID=UPI001F1165BA
MTEKNAIVLENLCDDLKSKKNVIGIILFGSLAKGNSHGYSDIDLFVIGHGEKHRTQSYFHDGIQIQIIWRSPEIFKDKVVKRTRTYPVSNTCKILYDKTGEIEEAIDQAKNNLTLGPLSLSDHDKLFKHADFSIEYYTIKGCIENGELATAVYIINEQVMLGIDLYYDKNNYYLVSPKHLISDLKTKNEALSSLAESIILESSLNEKMSLFETFREVILEIMGGELTDYELYW